MTVIEEYRRVRVVEVGMLAQIQERRGEHWCTVRECLPQFDTFDWKRAREVARALDCKCLGE